MKSRDFSLCNYHAHMSAGWQQALKGAHVNCGCMTSLRCQRRVPHLMPDRASKVSSRMLTGNTGTDGARAPRYTLVTVTARRLLKRSSVRGGGVQPGLRGRGRGMLMLWTSSSVCREARSASCRHADGTVDGAAQLQLLMPRPERHGEGSEGFRRHEQGVRQTKARLGT